MFFCWFLYICIKLELNTKTMCVWLSLLFSSSIVYLVLIDFNSVTKLRVRMKYKTLTHLWRIVYNEMHLPSCVFYCLLNSFNNCLTHLRCTFSDEHPTYYLDTYLKRKHALLYSIFLKLPPYNDRLRITIYKKKG